MLEVGHHVYIYDHELDLQAIRAQGAGGQNVNKVSSAIHLRFDIKASSLPEHYKQRLLALSDSRISRDGVLVLKSQEHRTQERNRDAALDRLADLIKTAMVVPKRRRETRPTFGSKKRRLEGKKQRAEVKKSRGRVDY